jgi:hypothetical protein
MTLEKGFKEQYVQKPAEHLAGFSFRDFVSLAIHQQELGVKSWNIIFTRYRVVGESQWPSVEVVVREFL